jgi:hypothetical protein
MNEILFRYNDEHKFVMLKASFSTPTNSNLNTILYIDVYFVCCPKNQLERGEITRDATHS